MNDENFAADKSIAIDSTASETSTAPLSRRPSGKATEAEDTPQTEAETEPTPGDDTCQNGSARCEGTDGEVLPCFACFEVDR